MTALLERPSNGETPTEDITDEDSSRYGEASLWSYWRRVAGPARRAMRGALHELNTAGGFTPCAVELEDEDLWFAQSRRKRQLAAALCRSCPLIAECRAYAAEITPGAGCIRRPRLHRCGQQSRANRQLLNNQLTKGPGSDCAWGQLEPEPAHAAPVRLGRGSGMSGDHHRDGAGKMVPVRRNLGQPCRLR